MSIVDKIDWKEYVDKVYVISYVKNFRKRKVIENELRRIGLYDYTIKYSVDNKILDHILPEYNKENMRSHSLYVTNTHYEAIKEAYYLGYESILVLEDDVVFLKDIEKIHYELELSKLSKANISMYDYISYDTVHIEEYKGYLYQLSSAYRLDRIGMEYMFKNVEHNLLVIDYYFGNCDQVIYPNDPTKEPHYINCWNPFNFELGYFIPMLNRICIQSREYEDGIHYDRGIYYDANVKNRNRIDPIIDDKVAEELYNFEEYIGY